MAHIVLADDGIEFDGESPAKGPLGGVESSIVNLTRALAVRGHDVSVYNMCSASKVIEGVSWSPLFNGLPETADLYIANRGDKLLPLMPAAGRTVFWIHNPAQYLLKWRYLSKLWRLKPAIIFIGNYHASTYPVWAPGGQRVVIPYGISDDFRNVPEAGSPPPARAIFTSNPLRSLDWLLDVWASRIHPQAPRAELHIFSGAMTYGRVGASKSADMQVVLDRARLLSEQGVVLRRPVPKQDLIAEFGKARVMMYKGDENETFCLAVGEAQAAGVPAVVQRYGSVVERVKDGQTGVIADNDTEFTEAAVALLKDDRCWRECHINAQRLQRSWGWADAARAFEELLPL
mgnify:FL=1